MKISILTATRDRADVLGAALDCLDAQTFTDWEHLIQDGGTDDATANLLAAHTDPRRTVRRSPDAGVYDALNTATRRATGEVVGILHSDDVFASADVLQQVATAFEDRAVAVVYGDLDYVSRHDPTHVVRRWRSHDFDARRLRRGWMPPHPTLFVRRSALQKVGPYDRSFQISADYDLMIRLLRSDCGVVRYIPQVLVRMRRGGLSNGSVRKLFHRSREDLQVLRKNGMGGYGALALKSLRKLPQIHT